MDFVSGAFLVILLYHGVYSGNVEVYGNTFSSILNKNYTEDVVSVRSELQCSMFCMATKYCEAILYNRTADDSHCILRKYTPNILYPLIIDASLPGSTSVMFLRKRGEYCVVPPGYQFEPNLMFWYKLVETPLLYAWEAREYCRQEKTYLLLIDDDNQYNFTVNLLEAQSVLTVYIQGYRITGNDPYLDDMGRSITYDQNWDGDGTHGSGKYMRIEAGFIETTPGGKQRPFICQLRLN